MAVMKLDVSIGIVDVTWIDEYRYTTSAPCVVHNKHIPGCHVNEIHHVWPRGNGGPDIAANRIVVCATGHNNVHRLITEYRLAHGNLPYSLLRSYAVGERQYAKLGYERITRQAM